jgi:hypothetical protein
MTIRMRVSGNMPQSSVVFLKIPLYRVSKERDGFLGGSMDFLDAISRKCVTWMQDVAVRMLRGTGCCFQRSYH